MTAPSTTPRSKAIRPETTWVPGRTTRVSLIVSPYRSARAARVTNETSVGATRGTSCRPMVNQAIATPTATTATMIRVSTSAGTGGSWWASSPTTGASQLTIQSPISITPPSTDSAASTTSGPVITLGDSCGCTSSDQRFWVKNVISISRVM